MYSVEYFSIEILHTFPLQRNCLHFALNAKPIRQYVPKFELHRKFHEKMLPVVNHAISKFIIVFALIVNCILLALVVSQEIVPTTIT